THSPIKISTAQGFLGITSPLGRTPFCLSFSIASFMVSSPGRGGGATVFPEPGSSDVPGEAPQPAVSILRATEAVRPIRNRLNVVLPITPHGGGLWYEEGPTEGPSSWGSHRCGRCCQTQRSLLAHARHRPLRGPRSGCQADEVPRPAYAGSLE